LNSFANILKTFVLTFLMCFVLNFFSNFLARWHDTFLVSSRFPWFIQEIELKMINTFYPNFSLSKATKHWI
jgi:hypothetical protein